MTATKTRPTVQFRDRSEEEKAGWIRISEFVRQNPGWLEFIEETNPELHQLVTAGIQTLSIDARSESWRDPREGRGARPEQLIPGTEGSFSDRTDWLTMLLVGGRGCVAAGTMIEDPFGGPSTPVEKWRGGWVWSLFDDGRFRPTYAEPAVMVGTKPLFRVTTDRGDEIVVTARHRFLTPSGWARLEDIAIGDEIASHPYRDAQSTCPVDGPHLTGTTGGSRPGYRQPARSRDRQSPWDSTAARVWLPSLADARVHSRRGCDEDDPTTTPGHSRPCPGCGHPSTGDALILPRRPDLETPWSVAPRPGPAPPSGPSLSTIPTLSLAERDSPRTRTALGPNSALDSPSPGQATPSTVVAIDPIGEGEYWDLTVPGAHNYIANGTVQGNSGKSRTGAEAVRELLFGRQWRTHPRVALVGQTLESVRLDMVENTLLEVLPPGCVVKWNRTRCELVLDLGMVEQPNGHEARRYAHLKGYSSDAPRKLRGAGGGGLHFAWCDECSSWTDADRSPNADSTTWSNLKMAVRLDDKPRNAVGRGTWIPRIIATTTPKSVGLIRNVDEHDALNPGKGIYDDPATVVSNMSTLDNEANLSEHYISTVIEPLKGTRLYEQEVEGKLVDVALGAQWSDELIRSMTRHKGWPETQAGGLKRVVIGVDPSIGAGLGDECGIVVSGIAEDGRVYVLEDLSIRAKASVWCEVVENAYNRHGAVCVVVEVNQGGELVEETIGRYAPNLQVVSVHAKKSKILRAEPVALLSDRDKVRFAGGDGDGDNPFARLQHQMRTWEGDGPSPDRLDAFVYSVLYLLPKSTGASNLITIIRGGTRHRRDLVGPR